MPLNQEQLNRIAGLKFNLGLSDLFNLQLGIDSKLTILLRNVADMKAKEQGRDKNNVLSELLDEVNQEMMDRFEDFYELQKNKK